MMKAKIFCVILGSIAGLLLYISYLWRCKAAEAAFAAAQSADDDKMRDRYCRLAVMAGHRDACRMFCLSRPDFFEDHQPLKPFKSHGIRTVFFGFYHPYRYHALLNEGQRTFSRSIYRFKDGKTRGIDFFKTCMEALQTDGKPYHIMFMPCSTDTKYVRRFKCIDWYIRTCRPELTSGLYDVEIFKERESLHAAKGGENRILERNYRITGNIEGKEIVIVDDVLTTGKSMTDYKEAIERCGGKAVAAVFYGKTVTIPPLLLIKIYVWGGYVSTRIKAMLE